MKFSFFLLLSFLTIPIYAHNTGNINGVVSDSKNGLPLIGVNVHYSLVPQKVELFDGNSYEGIGLAPDIYVKNQYEEVSAGIDRTLQMAIDRLK